MVQKPHARCKLVEPGSPEQRKLCAKPTREAKWAIEMQRQIRRQAWAEAHHLKSLEKLRREEREAQRESAVMLDWFRVKRALRHTKNWSDVHTGIVKPHMLRVIPARAGRSPLPRYQIAISDKGGRLFVFQRIRYYSARKTGPGHCAERAAYAIDGAYVEDGKAFIASSIGTTREEILEGTNVLEQVNRATSSNAKLAFHGIMQSCHLLTPEQQFDLASKYAEDTFGRQGLPYLVVLHPPSEEGDQRNWHVHLMYWLRPMEHISDGEWKIGRHLRTDLDTPEQFRRLRYLWAEALNQSCEKAGLARRYTHLSYAASGLDYEPQTHLGEGLTAKARRGERVEINVRNHRIAARNSARRALAATKAELLANVAATREALERSLRIAMIAQAFRQGQPMSSPSWQTVLPTVSAPPKAPERRPFATAHTPFTRPSGVEVIPPNQEIAAPLEAKQWARVPASAKALSLPTLPVPGRTARPFALNMPPAAVPCPSLPTTNQTSQGHWQLPVHRTSALPGALADSCGPAPWGLSFKGRQHDLSALKLPLSTPHSEPFQGLQPSVVMTPPRLPTDLVRAPTFTIEVGTSAVPPVGVPHQLVARRWALALSNALQILPRGPAQAADLADANAAPAAPTQVPVSDRAPPGHSAAISHTVALPEPPNPASAQPEASAPKNPIATGEISHEGLEEELEARIRPMLRELQDYRPHRHRPRSRTIERLRRSVPKNSGLSVQDGFLNELRTRPVVVVPDAQGKVRPAIMSWGRRRLTHEHISGPEVQTELQRMWQRQCFFVQGVMPIAETHLDSSTIEKGTDAAIDALPKVWGSEAARWSQTGLLHEILKEVRERGLRRSAELLKRWKDAKARNESQRYKLAAETLAQQRRWPLFIEPGAEKDLMADNAHYQQAIAAAASGAADGAPAAASDPPEPDCSTPTRSVVGTNRDDTPSVSPTVMPDIGAAKGIGTLDTGDANAHGNRGNHEAPPRASDRNDQNRSAPPPLPGFPPGGWGE